MSSKPMRALRTAAIGLGLTCAGLVLWPVWLQANDNFHMVKNGVLYRSAQPGPGDLARAVQNHGIHSVLNLRGAQPDAEWYQVERRDAAALGLQHVDFAMSASRKPDPQDVAALLKVMRDLPKPVLIHCRSGSDRTGFAAALYLAELAGADKEVAERQLSFAYGHVGIPMLSAAWPMDQGWQEVEAQLPPAS
ncbi:tyrosine-protein phosphatase [Gemmobacter serpentinus]|uniref:tyrosine-protein phosphatase n=1 Tax=Gemmobacter serpentinus TaxID=2652247 RepID=UPI001CF683A9|nr:tyrosine-protein phosphatase [Gemmobacter serpentinus]